MFDPILQNAFILALFGLLLSIVGIASLLVGERRRIRLGQRLARATGSGRSDRAAVGSVHRGTLAHLQSKIRAAMVQTGERLAVILGGEAEQTAADLSSAGYRSRDALLIYAFLKTCLPLVAVAVGMIWVLSQGEIGIDMLLPSAIVVGAALSLSKSVDLFVAERRKERLTRIRRGFPDMLELLVISSEAGLGPQPALHRVGRELEKTNPEIASEILQMLAEMRLTNDRRAAYDKLNVRVPLPEIGVFTQTLDQSDTYGTPFSRAMRTLIEEQRANRLMAVEEKAARLPVIMTLPLIFCIMPAVFVVLIGPAALTVFDNIISGG